MNIPEEIHEIIISKIIGEVNKEQELRLQAWLDTDPRNRKDYQEICSLWFSGKWAVKRENIQKSQGWNRIVRTRREGRKKRLITAWCIGTAASILFVLGIFTLFPSGERENYIAGQVESRQANVMLILASGEQINMGENIHREIVEEGMVIRSDSALLEYKDEMQHVSEELVYNELIVPKCGEYKLRLSDGSLVILNSESKLRYPVNFSGDSREVFLSGEACFEVSKDERKPFIVHTDQANVKVLGTLFNVSAYTDEQYMQITLVNGSVQVNQEKEQHLLKPGQQYSLNNETLEKKISDVDSEAYIAWTNGLFRFDAMPLEQLMLKLSRWIPITYQFNDESLKKIRFTGGFKKYDDVNHMLKMLSEIIDVSFKINKQAIIIDRR